MKDQAKAAAVSLDRADAYARSSARQWWLVVVMMLLTTVAGIDLQVVALLANAIKADLALNDTQLALVVSAGFAIANVLFTLPAGYLVDRINRKTLAGAGAIVWSIMTVAGGFAGTFGRLVTTRAGVGVGEAVIIPCSLSMIRSALPPERRGRGFAIYSMHQLLGAGFAMLTGGVLVHLAASGAFAGVPFVGHRRPWEIVLVLVGIMGLPFIALLLTVREPPRLEDNDAPGASIGYGAALRHMRQGWRAYAPLLLFSIVYSMMARTYGVWLAAMLGRAWGLSMSQIGLAVGLMMLLLPPVGLLTSGGMIDWLGRRLGARGICLIGLVTIALNWTVAWILPLSPTIEVLWVLMVVSFIVGTSAAPVTPSLVARITPDRLMGKVTGIQYFLVGIFSGGVGPVLVGVASDSLFTGPKALAYSLSLVSFVYGVVAVAAILVCLRTIPAYERSRS